MANRRSRPSPPAGDPPRLRLGMVIIRLVSLGCIAIGGLIYILWRPDSLTVFGWLEAAGMLNSVSTLRQQGAGLGTMLPAWVLFSLPQALWVFGGSLALHSIWGGQRRWPRHLWMLFFFGIAIAGEIGQAAGLVRGAFDSVDLLLIITAYLAARLFASNTIIGLSALRSGR